MNNRHSSINEIHSFLSQRTSPNQAQSSSNSESIPFSRDMLTLVWERMSQMSLNERTLLISHLRSGGVRINQEAEPNQLSLNANDIQISHCETEEDYLDFRHYPMPIDWNQIENGEDHYYSFLTDYGYFGISLVTSFSKLSKKFNLASGSLYQSILEHYHRIAEGKLHLEIEEFFNLLPNFNQIKTILVDEYYFNKELPMIKLVLDIYEHCLFIYDKKQLNIQLRSDYISIANLFYDSLNDKEVMFIYDQLSKQKKAFQVIKLLHMFIAQSKTAYMKHVNKLSLEYKFLLEGTNDSLFVL